jgi:hypothetical protein
MTESTGVVTAATDAGMVALWCPATFAAVDGYPAWETHVHERLPAAIASGELVPLNIGHDGAYGVRVAVAPEGLSEREARYAFVTSEPYLLVVVGDEACLSGLEDVGDPEYADARIPLPRGRYAARVTVLDWERDPESTGPDGTPTEHALPDYVVVLTPEDGTETYRTAELTFDPVG